MYRFAVFLISFFILSLAEAGEVNELNYQDIRCGLVSKFDVQSEAMTKQVLVFGPQQVSVNLRLASTLSGQSINTNAVYNFDIKNNKISLAMSTSASFESLEDQSHRQIGSLDVFFEKIKERPGAHITVLNNDFVRMRCILPVQKVSSP